jgi:predicted nucleic acid-binding protein
VRIALDTNILVRLANQRDPAHLLVKAALRELIAAGAVPVIAPQVVYEFWVVATRPASVNGLEMIPAAASAYISASRQKFPVLPDPIDLVDRWLNLCETHRVLGRPAHDARLAAWMAAHGISELVTLNPGDFARFPGVRCVGLS